MHVVLSDWIRGSCSLCPFQCFGADWEETSSWQWTPHWLWTKMVLIKGFIRFLWHFRSTFLSLAVSCVCSDCKAYLSEVKAVGALWFLPVSPILYFQVHDWIKSPDFTERVELSAKASTLGWKGGCVIIWTLIGRDVWNGSAVSSPLSGLVSSVSALWLAEWGLQLGSESLMTLSVVFHVSFKSLYTSVIVSALFCYYNKILQWWTEY